MNLATAKKSGTRPRIAEQEIESRLARLARENALLKKEVAQLQTYRALAYRDPLTGLWNRRFFDERLKEELSRSQRAGSGRKFSVMVVDINNFKRINDTHGHQVGDALLHWVGAFLTGHLRTHDVACRTGGDEFAVLLPDLSEEDCGRILARLRVQLKSANTGREIPVSLSLGTASWPTISDSAQLLAQADQAMYTDKRRQKAEDDGRTDPAGAAPFSPPSAR